MSKKTFIPQLITSKSQASHNSLLKIVPSGHFYEISFHFPLYIVNFVCYSRDFSKVVRYKHEFSLRKDAKPNQKVEDVRYNREFVVTVIVTTELDCSNKKNAGQKS